MRTFLLILFPLLLSAQNSIAIAQTAQGSATGNTCANAYAATFFNTSGNWSGSVQTPGTYTYIGPGTTVHLCGTFTGSANGSMLQANGSGTSGNPITLLFESGATFTAPYWSYTGTIPSNTAAINLETYSYITVDGGGTGTITPTGGASSFTPNGIIENTANGTTQTYKQATTGVFVGTGNNNIVQNLTFENLYQRSGNLCDGNGSQCFNDTLVNAISAGSLVGMTAGAANDIIQNNLIYNAGWAILCCGDNGQVHNNDIYWVDHGAVMNAPHWYFYDNYVHDAAVWLDTGNDPECGNSPCNAFHHDGIHCFANQTFIGYAYNNYFVDYGAPGTGYNQPIFLEGAGSSTACFVSAWKASTSYSLGALITVNGYAQQVTTGGMSGGSSPSWNNTPAGTTTDSGVTWTNEGLSGLGSGVAGGGTSYAFNNVSLMRYITNYGGPPEGDSSGTNTNSGDLYANNLNKGLSVYNNTGTPPGITVIYIPNAACYACFVSVYNNAVSGLGTGFDVSPDSANNFIDYDAFENCTSSAGCFITNLNTNNCNGCSYISAANATANGHTGAGNLLTQTTLNSAPMESHGIASSTLASMTDNDFFLLSSACVVPMTGPNLIPPNCAETASSPLRAAGKNLYSVCNGQPNPGLGALCYDINGVARPSTGAWDIGAYQYQAPPTFIGSFIK